MSGVKRIPHSEGQWKEKEQQLQNEKAKNKLLFQRQADQIALKRQTFVDALVMSSMPYKEAEAKLIVYTKNGGIDPAVSKFMFLS